MRTKEQDALRALAISRLRHWALVYGGDLSGPWLKSGGLSERVDNDGGHGGVLLNSQADEIDNILRDKCHLGEWLIIKECFIHEDAGRKKQAINLAMSPRSLERRLNVIYDKIIDALMSRYAKVG